MKTELLYLSDSYLKEANSGLIETGADDKGKFLIVDETPFYPQGGGQPADVGFIISGEHEMAIEDVRMLDGVVRHYMRADAAPEIPLGGEVICAINWEKRYRNARCHTAGHLVAHAVEQLFEDMKAIKGYHFEEGAYVEFVSERAVDTVQSEAVDEIIRKWVQDELIVTVSYMNVGELGEIEHGSKSASPFEGAKRFVGIGDISPIQCGGTHVKSLAALNDVQISKIKRKGGNMRIGYSWK